MAVRILHREVLVDDITFIESSGEVGDTKPEGRWAQCSSYMELDPTNHKLTPYFWNESTNAWISVGGDS